MGERPTESVQSMNDKHLHAALLDGVPKLIPRGPGILTAGNSLIDVLTNVGPATVADEFAEITDKTSQGG